MDEAEYQRRHDDLKFDIQILNGLISGLICLEIVFTVLFVISIGADFSWYIALPVYALFAGITILLICNCLKSIKKYELDLEDLIQPFG